MRIFGIDPGSERTGYGCVESDGSRHRLVRCGAITAPARASFPERLHHIHGGLVALLARVPARRASPSKTSSTRSTSAAR